MEHNFHSHIVARSLSSYLCLHKDPPNVILSQTKREAFRKIVQVLTFSTATFVFQEAQALVTEPALYYSGHHLGGIVLQAEDPKELVETHNRYMKIRFDECMSQSPPVSCVLLEINREHKSITFTNGLPNAILWYMRQTNVRVNQGLKLEHVSK